MEAAGELWTSISGLYFIPVAGVFGLASLVYYLSFRKKEEDDNQSLRNYLNVLSGDDEKNRKAAKKLRKFGTMTKRFTAAGSGIDGEGDGKQVDDDSDTEKRADTMHANPPVERLSIRKPTQSSSSSSKKADLPGATAYSASRRVQPVEHHQSAHSSRGVTPNSRVPEVVTTNTTNGAGDEPVGVSHTPAGDGILDDGETAPEVAAASGWHKATSRKEKKHSVGLESKMAQDNHSTTSDESRPSFRNSNSSRNSSPYRNNTHYNTSSHNHHHVSASPVYETRKFNGSRKTLAKPPHLLQRPDHLKLEPSSVTPRRTSATAAASTATVPRPTILLSQAPPEAAPKKLYAAASATTTTTTTTVVLPGGSLSFRTTIPRIYAASDHARSSVLPPGQSDMCVQTEANEEYPSPLEGLRQVDAGKPRFIICHDFQVQVDFDSAENGSESESELRFEDGDKILYSSGASLSSGEGSSRVTPVLEDDCSGDFTMTAEKSQGVHPRNQFYKSRTSPRHQSAQPNFPSRNSDPNSNLRNGEGKRGGGGDGVYCAGHNDLRTCRVEKGARDWIDNSSRRTGVQAPVSGRWRN